MSKYARCSIVPGLPPRKADLTIVFAGKYRKEALGGKPGRNAEPEKEIGEYISDTNGQSSIRFRNIYFLCACPTK
jgi:hypothetical protein